MSSNIKVFRRRDKTKTAYKENPLFVDCLGVSELFPEIIQGDLDGDDLPSCSAVDLA